MSGRRGVGILYAYMLLGLGFLRAVSPDFGNLASEEQELEGTFRLILHCLLCLGCLGRPDFLTALRIFLVLVNLVTMYKVHALEAADTR